MLIGVREQCSLVLVHLVSGCRPSRETRQWPMDVVATKGSGPGGGTAGDREGVSGELTKRMC